MRRGEAAVDMQRARSVTGPLRRAHPASGATWNVQVVRGKMSSKCLWHACRALSAGLLLMLLGGAMAVIGYYADTLSVDQEVRGNSTVSVKDEARGFHLNNLSYAGPIVMGFGGFIVVAACVMTFEARDSAAKVTPARPQALPRPLPRRGPQCAAPARLDQLGVYRLPHVLPLPHSLPLQPLLTLRHRPAKHKKSGGAVKWGGTARSGSAPNLSGDIHAAFCTTPPPRFPLRRYAVSVDEPHHPVVRPLHASAAESECGSQSSLAMDLHGSGECAGITLRVRDNSRRRPLARQQRLRDDTMHPTPVDSTYNINNNGESGTAKNEHLSGIRNQHVETGTRSCSAPPCSVINPPLLDSPPLYASPPPQNSRLFMKLCIEPPNKPRSESCFALTAANSASCVTIVPLPNVTRLLPADVPDVTTHITPVLIKDVAADVLDTPNETPIEPRTETCITIEQTQQDCPCEEETVPENSEPPLAPDI